LILWPSKLLPRQTDMEPKWGFDAAIQIRGGENPNLEIMFFPPNMNWYKPIDLGADGVLHIYLNPEPEHSESEIAGWLWRHLTAEGRKFAFNEMKKMWEQICKFVIREEWEEECHRLKGPFTGRAAYCADDAGYDICFVEGYEHKWGVERYRPHRYIYSDGILSRWLQALQDNDWRVTIFAETEAAINDLVAAVTKLPQDLRYRAEVFEYKGVSYRLNLPENEDWRPHLSYSDRSNYVLYHDGLFKAWLESIDYDKLAEAESTKRRIEMLVAYIEANKKSRKFLHDNALYVLSKDELHIYRINPETNDWELSNWVYLPNLKVTNILEVWAESLGWKE